MNTKDKKNELKILSKQLKNHTDYLNDLIYNKSEYLSKFNQKVYDTEILNTLFYMDMKYRKEIYEIYMDMK